MAPQTNISEPYLKRLATVHDNQDVASQTIREMASELLSLRQQIAQRQAPTVEPAMLNTCLAFDKQELAQAVPGKCEPVAEVLWYEPMLHEPQTKKGHKIIDASLSWMEKAPLGTKLYTAPPAIDDETRRMVLELCDIAEAGELGIQQLKRLGVLPGLIREKLEAGNGN